MKTLSLDSIIGEVTRSVEDTFYAMFATKVDVRGALHYSEGHSRPLRPSKVEELGTSLLAGTNINSLPLIQGQINAEDGSESCKIEFRFPKTMVHSLLQTIYGDQPSESINYLEQGVGEIANVISTKTRGRLNNSGYKIKINNPKINNILELPAQIKNQVTLPVHTENGPFEIIFYFNRDCRYNSHFQQAS